MKIDLRVTFRKEINRTNKPGTCLYCGRKLKKSRTCDTVNKGDYADNAFCGLRCGYSFGVCMAALDYKLTPRSTKEGGY